MRPVLFTLLLLAKLPAVADLLPVSAMGIIEQDRFTLSRNYAGQLHARRTSELGFESGGVLSDIAVREGEPVLKGQQLMSLAPDAMVARLRQAEATSATAGANLVASRARLELAAITERRYAELVSRGHGSQQQLDELHSQYQVEAANVDVAVAQLQNAGLLQHDAEQGRGLELCGRLRDHRHRGRPARDTAPTTADPDDRIS